MKNEIKVGDKVRVSEDAPRMVRDGITDPDKSIEMRVVEIEDGCALIQTEVDSDFYINFSVAVPTKYLIKVDTEAKEPKFKKGDKVRFKKVYTVVSVDDGQVFIDSAGNHIDEDCLEPYTEPTEQKKPNVGSIKIPVEIDLSDSYWDAYAADLAKEVALKVAKKFNAPHEAAEYAVSVAKAVMEGLKRK